MQKNLFVLIMLLLPFFSTAQEDSTAYVQEYKAIGKINIFDLSNGVEIKLGKTFTTYQQVGFVWGLTTQPEVSIEFTPLYLGEFRYYHNMKGRIRRGKRVEGFFANYFALQYHVPPPTAKSNFCRWLCLYTLLCRLTLWLTAQVCQKVVLGCESWSRNKLLF